MRYQALLFEDFKFYRHIHVYLLLIPYLSKCFGYSWCLIRGQYQMIWKLVIMSGCPKVFCLFVPSTYCNIDVSKILKHILIVLYLNDACIILCLSFCMENYTSLSIASKIVWHEVMNIMCKSNFMVYWSSVASKNFAWHENIVFYKLVCSWMSPYISPKNKCSWSHDSSGRDSNPRSVIGVHSWVMPKTCLLYGATTQFQLKYIIILVRASGMGCILVTKHEIWNRRDGQ